MVGGKSVCNGLIAMLWQSEKEALEEHCEGGGRKKWLNSYHRRLCRLIRLQELYTCYFDILWLPCFYIKKYSGTFLVRDQAGLNGRLYMRYRNSSQKYKAEECKKLTDYIPLLF